MTILWRDAIAPLDNWSNFAWTRSRSADLSVRTFASGKFAKTLMTQQGDEIL
ncbi:hypothetical protein NDI37_23770 [Funiculus sociatus GB2-A5]|uniref:Uncharacterized protein n=1 Tax=Funiculus sociatus GB2-A5 TaxID=2933946 RepID=A0ABV0JVS7_9CYAN|nr:MULTISPECIES: hypothetical protein [unclassified Trichocoleus]MBD1903950.1 hypothetical protein [Trichocoleus sp. FACHB-832]MBD2061831.1 hypothetical protein [Trichocoleus sp. FACHB-6]